MPNSQYGNLLFIESFDPGVSTKSLQRISLEKNTKVDAPYNEAWLQRAAVRPALSMGTKRRDAQSHFGAQSGNSLWICQVLLKLKREG
jgi:hypothetical protein